MFTELLTKPLGMQPSYWVCKPAYNSVTSQDKLGGSIWHKNGGLIEAGASVSLHGVASSRIGVCLLLLSSPCTIKPRWHAKIQLLGITTWTPPHAYTNRRWGNSARTQHNSVLRQRFEFMRT